jgi:uncharacterized membrane protein YeaQ/YmgE (transglycosylase-associated protein family)
MLLFKEPKMIEIIVWIAYGVVVGMISKAIYRYKDSPKGLASTLAIGVCGSFVGGFISHMMGQGNPIQPSGFFMGVLGGVITSFLYRRFVVKDAEKRMMRDGR